MAKPFGPYYWTITVGVAPLWIADGLDLTEDRVESILMSAYPHIRGDEFDISIDEAPDPGQIKAEQSGREVNGRFPMICPITERLVDDCTCDQCVDNNPVSAATVIQQAMDAGENLDDYALQIERLVDMVLNQDDQQAAAEAAYLENCAQNGKCPSCRERGCDGSCSKEGPHGDE